MSRLNHSFSVEHAELYGVECAILIAHFQFWIEQNQRMERNFHDGKTWMFQTQKEIAALYPYWNEDFVFRTIKKLIDMKVLVKGNFNKTPFDKTAWYAFENEKMFTKPQICGIGTADLRNQIPQNCGIRNRNSAECIMKDTNKDTKEEEEEEEPIASASAASLIFSEKDFENLEIFSQSLNEDYGLIISAFALMRCKIKFGRDVCSKILLRLSKENKEIPSKRKDKSGIFTTQCKELWESRKKCK